MSKKKKEKNYEENDDNIINIRVKRKMKICN